MFDGLGDVGQKRLRAYLQEHPFCSIVASAQNLFTACRCRPRHSMLFLPHRHLAGLDFEHAVRLLTNIATYEGDRELASFIDSPLGRAASVPFTTSQAAATACMSSSRSF